MIDSKHAEKGDQGETELQAWFDRYGFAYVRIRQDDITFSRLFKQNEVKRPDFLVLVDSIGMIAVDAKFKKLSRSGNQTLSFEAEVRKAILFERIFRLPVWYAYRGPDAETWYWISALKAFEVGVKYSKEKDYLEIATKEFACLRTGADFAQLYTQRMPGLKRLRAKIAK